jgi:hypothetical protein
VMLHGFGMIRWLSSIPFQHGAPSASAAYPEMAVGIPLHGEGDHER